MEGWLKDYYRCVDALDIEPFMAHHSDDCEVTFGNNPTAKGSAEIRQNMEGFWGMLKGIRHDAKNVWTVDDGATTVLEANVTFSTHDGQDVTLPSTSLLHRANDKVDSLRVFIDMAPLFAAMTPGDPA